jgi:uncharacterized repeat protein (TIGR02543 family)
MFRKVVLAALVFFLGVVALPLDNARAASYSFTITLAGNGNTHLDGQGGQLIPLVTGDVVTLQNGAAGTATVQPIGAASVSSVSPVAGGSCFVNGAGTVNIPTTESCDLTIGTVGTFAVFALGTNLGASFQNGQGGAQGGGSGGSGSSPTPQPVSLWRATLDPNGGTCLDGGVSQSAKWTKLFLGYGYLPGASDCSKPGHVFVGWADPSTPATARSFPSLIDEDGQSRFFVADNVDLVAMWTPTVSAPSLFEGVSFCGKCGKTLIWSAPSDGTTVRVTGPDGREVCAASIVSDDGKWVVCGVPDGLPGTYSLTAYRSGVASATKSALVR